jgi:hypothetical protein
MGVGGRLLHAEATVEDGSGGTKDVTAQRGTVTALAGDRLTVRSSDGFTRDYVVDADTRIALNGRDGIASSLHRGDEVHVVAVRKNGVLHADSVLDGHPLRPLLRLHGRPFGVARAG